MAKTDTKLAYLTIQTPLPNVYIGGVMVTDHRGLPIEFRYSEPIQPTKIQQVLYGQVLSTYIKEEVILDTLMKGVNAKFDCLVVEDESLLNYPLKGGAIVRMTETNSPVMEGLGQTETISNNEILIQASQQNPPIRIHYNPSSQEGSSPGRPYQSILDALHQMDVVEPMKRIGKALELICQEMGINSQTS